jgi:hypothetical protein
MPYLRSTCALIALLLAGAAIPVATQTPGLRIVVLEGEDAVNIIQQKTAVAPLVEVRDRNNLPVPGVAVTFTVGGQSASFGGLSTLTVTTNAAGQAAAVGLTPTAAGAVQINAAAVFQGQTAVATITQTNVLTAAQAASAAGATTGASGGAGGGSASAGGAAAGGGGGGLSATTIGIVGAAVGGGALVATQVGGSGSEEIQKREWGGTFTGEMLLDFVGPPRCVRIQRHSGFLTIELDETTDGSARGTAQVNDGVVNILSLNGSPCGGPQPGQTDRFGMPNATVTGTLSSLTFSQTLSNPAADGSGTINTNVFTFNGARNGDTIVGTFTQTLRIESSGRVTSGTITVPMTLTPH